MIYIYLFMVLGIGLITAALAGPNKYSAARLQIPQEAYKKDGFSLRRIILGVIPSRKLLETIRLGEGIKHRLEAGHVVLSVVEFFNLKLMLMFVLTAALYFGIGKSEIWVFAIGLIAGYILPDVWLSRKIAQRKYSIARILPETVDLLGLCVEAGLDFTTAVRWILEKCPINPMMEELTLVLEEIKWGKSRTQALRDMSKRLNIPEVSSFVQTLVQAERMGTPVAEAFMILSEDTRMQRFHRGERFAMQAPIKILIPLIFCILPVIGIVIGGPILLQFTQGTMFSLGGR